MTPPLCVLAQQLGHVFSNTALLQQALTHRSFCADHNERLEFLGDAVLDVVISGLLFTRLPHAPEGDLSRIRAFLVNQDSLSAIACKLDVARFLRLGEGELRSGGLQRPSILSGTLEALIGAVFQDAGYAAAEAVVLRLFADVDLSGDTSTLGKDAKTTVQEWLQAHKIRVPTYVVADVQGAAHARTFQVDACVPALGLVQRGSGTSRRAAEQDAASQLLQQLRSMAPARLHALAQTHKPRTSARPSGTGHRRAS